MFVMKAVAWSINRQSIIGIMANGRIKTLVPVVLCIIPTNMGNNAAERMTKVNFLAL